MKNAIALLLGLLVMTLLVALVDHCMNSDKDWKLVVIAENSQFALSYDGMEACRNAAKVITAKKAYCSSKKTGQTEEFSSTP